MTRPKVAMTAEELLRIASCGSNVSAKDVHQLVAEVFRFRGKLRARNERINDLEEELGVLHSILGGRCNHEDPDDEALSTLGSAHGFGAQRTGKG